MNPELAEICGIIAGDGHLSRYISPKRTHYKISIFGHREDDREYFSYVQKLFFRNLGKELRLKERENHIELRVNSKKILEKFENIGIPVGNKSGIVKIPESIKKDLNLSLNFIRGVADTDFSLIFRKRKTIKSWPRITADIKSKQLIYDICEILRIVDIKVAGPYTRNRVRNESPYTAYQIDINGHENFQKWMKLIGFRNKKHRIKIGREQNVTLFP